MVEASIMRPVRRDVDPSTYAEATQKNSFDHRYSSDSVVVTLSIALALYNSLEMILLVFSTFKKWKGLYFWSLTICNYGVMLYAIGLMMGYWRLGPRPLGNAILDIGWVAMLTCQSLVLYSRLGLIVRNQNILRAVKWMIVFGGSVMCTIVVILDFGNTYTNIGAFHKGYFYIEQIQLIYFTIQELIISFLYVWKTLAFLRVVSKENTRSMIWQLFVINVIIIAMDIVIVVLQFRHYQLKQESIKGFVYSVKLKLELNILSKLVDLVQDNNASRRMTVDIIDSNAIVGQAQADVRREMAQNEGPNWYGGDEKRALETNEKDSEPGPSDSGSSTQPNHNDGDGMARVFSVRSSVSARTAHREVDNWYADIMRSTV